MLARNLAFYPQTNERVRASCESAMQVFRSALEETGGHEVVVLISRTEVLAGSSRLPLEQRSNLRWLLVRLESCRLAGALFGPELKAPALTAFTRHLLEGYRRTQLDPEFERLDTAAPEGIRPVEHRFDGDFREGDHEPERSWLEALLAPDAAARTDPLALLAARDPRVRESLERLINLPEVASAVDGGRVKVADLLSAIVRSLPAESTRREEDLVRDTLEVLEAIHEDPTGSGSSADGSSEGRSREESLLARALADVSRQVFARQGLTPEEVVQRQYAGLPGERIPPALRGHSLDERIADDLDALLREVDRLPSQDAADQRLTQAEDPVEQLGVFLHYLTSLESDEEAALARKPAVRLIGETGPAGREVLDLYLRAFELDTALPAVARHQRRLREFLRESGLVEVLTQVEGLNPDTVIDLFPQRFGEWLDSIDVAEPEQLASVVDVCYRVGADRIRACASELERTEDIGRPARRRKLLAIRDPAVAPIVRVLLGRANVELRRKLARFAESIVGGREEACLLRLVDADELPRRYLADLLDPPTGGEERKQARALIADTLAELVERWAGQPTVARRRLKAVRLLGRFQSRHGAEVLNRLTRRGKLFRSAFDADLQRAAREALRFYP